MRNIILIGFMGTGKTAVARMLAKVLGYNFVDTDERIEYATGLRIVDVWKKYGEKRFRSEEELVLKKLQNTEKQIIAIGGGIDLNPKAFTYLGEDNLVVLLESTPEIIYHRLARKNTRCMLGKKVTPETVKAALEERHTVYRAFADMIIDTSQYGLEEIATKIVAEWKKKGGLS